MEWAPREYKSYKLKLLLKGAELALYDKDIMLRLHSFEENYRTVFYISVEKYKDPSSGWNKKRKSAGYTLIEQMSTDKLRDKTVLIPPNAAEDGHKPV